MSGFALAFNRSGESADAGCAQGMLRALTAFGTDRKSANADGPFDHAWVFSSGFTPQDSNERQPVAAGERWILLFIGRLSYREELADKLRLSETDLQRTPDCELAMQAWLKWGRDCTAHLYGGYSFVVADKQERCVTVIRSHERSQKLYYFVDRNRFVISTSTKPIFSLPDVERVVDDLKIADALILNYEDVNRTYFQGVSAIGQGQILEVGSEGEPRVDRIDLFGAVAPVRYPNEEDYLDHARSLLASSVANTFRSPNLPAISLSAGLDSTAVAVAMIEHMRKSGTAQPGALKAYIAVPGKDWDGRVRENRIGDESGPVRAFAAMYPEIDAQFISADYLAFDQGVDMIQSFADMPVRGVGNSSWGAGIFERCRQDRRTMLVSGTGGNFTLSFAAAHILFAKWLREGNWLKLMSELRRFAARRPGTKASSVLAQALLTNAPDAIYDWYMRQRGHDRTTGYQSFSAIHPDFARDIGVRERMRNLDWDDRYRRKPDRQEMMKIMLERGARHDAAGLIEPNKAMTGVESAAPLEDRKLMEFCYAIPDDQFYKDGVDRRLIRRMMADKLPKEVLTAPRGEQASDWHGRTKRDLDRIEAEIDRLADTPELAGKLDIERMRRVIREWPDETPISNADYPDYALARHGIGRALAVARFINQVEGRN